MISGMNKVRPLQSYACATLVSRKPGQDLAQRKRVSLFNRTDYSSTTKSPASLCPCQVFSNQSSLVYTFYRLSLPHCGPHVMGNLGTTSREATSGAKVFHFRLSSLHESLFLVRLSTALWPARNGKPWHHESRSDEWGQGFPFSAKLIARVHILCRFPLWLLLFLSLDVMNTQFICYDDHAFAQLLLKMALGLVVFQISDHCSM